MRLAAPTAPARQTRGPAEALLGSLLGDVAGAGAGTLELGPASRRSQADFQIDLRDLPTDGERRPDGKSAAEALVETLTRLPAVESAVAFERAVHVTTPLEFLQEAVLSAIERDGPSYGRAPAGSREPFLVTFSDPNTNKPLHVGHLRNLFLGGALASLHEALGHPVRREGTFGDWGVHMCQALVRYLAEAPAATPDSEGVKGDHFVGHFYTGYHRDDAGTGDAAASDAGDLLLALERGEGPAGHHRDLVRWAAEGIRETYRRVGARFDALHHESDHLTTARAVLEDGVGRGVLRQRPDGSVVFDDRDADAEVPLTRSDGTLLVYPQILGIDADRFEGRPERILSVFGHQWEAAALSYRNLARALGFPWAERYEPLFYAMVQLPGGAMRSREGNTVMADQAVDDLTSALRPRLPGNASVDAEALAVAVLRYHLLRTPRTKTLVFDPAQVAKRSAPAFARLATWAGLLPRTVRSNAGGSPDTPEAAVRRVLRMLDRFPAEVEKAAAERDPALLLRSLDDLVALCEQREVAGALGSRIEDAVSVVVSQGLRTLDMDHMDHMDHMAGAPAAAMSTTEGEVPWPQPA